MDIARIMIRKKKFNIFPICRVLGVSRSNQYASKFPRPKRYKRKEDEVIKSEILSVIKDRGTYGYRRATALINRSRRKTGSSTVNKKRVLRVMQLNKLILRKQRKRPERLHRGKVVTLQSNMRYCSDIFQIKCWDGNTVYVAFSLDCHDRSVLGYVAKTRPLTHRDIIELIDQSVVNRFGDWCEKLPQSIEWLSDQGPQYTSHTTIDYLKQWGFIPCTTPAYSPESNGIAESFVNTYKRDFVHVNELWTASTVLRQLPIWFDDYDKIHPHSGLNYKSPMEYRSENLDSFFNPKVSV